MRDYVPTPADGFAILLIPQQTGETAMSIRIALSIISFALALADGALAQNPSTMAPATAAPAQNRTCATCGTLESIRYVEQKGQASGGGAVVGGVLGGVVGHQFGSGRGNTVATIAGVGVGALAGNESRRTSRKRPTTRSRCSWTTASGRPFRKARSPISAKAIGSAS